MSKPTHAGVKRLGWLVAAALATFTVVGCGSGSNADDTSNSSGTSSSVEGPSIEQLTGEGLETAPPTTGPAVKAGANVWWVSCGMVAPDCAVPANAAKKAAEKLGWKFSIADGKLNDGGGFVTAMQTAIGARPDAIFIHALDCNIIKSQIDQANKEGVKLVAVETAACPGATEMNYAPEIPDGDSYFGAWGKQAAQYIIAKTGGKAKVIFNDGTDGVFPPISAAFVETMKTCSGCEIVDTIKFTNAEQGVNGPWIQRLRAAMVKNPTANAVFMPSDNLGVSVGGAKAVKSANPDALTVDGGSGTGPGLSAVGTGDLDAIGAAHDAEWLGYAAVDTVNRVLNGEPTVPEGVGVRAVDKSNLSDVQPATDEPYASPVDWEAAYLKLWGVS